MGQPAEPRARRRGDFFGERAVSVAVAKQLPDARGKTVYRLRGRRLDPTSWRHQQFQQASPRPVGRDRSPLAGATSPPLSPFSGEWLGMLGFLPAEAQRFMLHPFGGVGGVGGDDLVADGRFCKHSSMGWVELTMLLWAWDRRVVVLASGHLSGPVDNQAGWALDHLVCRHVRRPASTTQL